MTNDTEQPLAKLIKLATELKAALNCVVNFYAEGIDPDDATESEVTQKATAAMQAAAALDTLAAEADAAMLRLELAEDELREELQAARSGEVAAIGRASRMQQQIDSLNLTPTLPWLRVVTGEAGTRSGLFINFTNDMRYCLTNHVVHWRQLTLFTCQEILNAMAKEPK
jgi:hypothetical protein